MRSRGDSSADPAQGRARPPPHPARPTRRSMSRAVIARLAADPDSTTFAVPLPPGLTAMHRTLVGATPELLLEKRGPHRAVGADGRLRAAAVRIPSPIATSAEAAPIREGSARARRGRRMGGRSAHAVLPHPACRRAPALRVDGDDVASRDAGRRRAARPARLVGRAGDGAPSDAGGLRRPADAALRGDRRARVVRSGLLCGRCRLVRCIGRRSVVRDHPMRRDLPERRVESTPAPASSPGRIRTRRRRDVRQVRRRCCVRSASTKMGGRSRSRPGDSCPAGLAAGVRRALSRAGYWRGETFGEFLRERAAADTRAHRGRRGGGSAALDVSRARRARRRAWPPGFSISGSRRAIASSSSCPTSPSSSASSSGCSARASCPVFALPAHRSVEIAHFATVSEASGYVIPAVHDASTIATLAAQVHGTGARHPSRRRRRRSRTVHRLCASSRPRRRAHCRNRRPSASRSCSCPAAAPDSRS